MYEYIKMKHILWFPKEYELPEMPLHVSHTLMCPSESLYKTQWAPSTL